MHTFKTTTFALLAPLMLAFVDSTSQNHGIVHGWDGTNHEHRGTVSQVSDQTSKPDTAINVVQIYDSSYTCRHHSEVVKKDAYKTYNIAQFISDLTDHPDNTCKDTYIPSMMLWVEKDKLSIRSKGGDMCDSTLKKFDGKVTLEQSGIPTTYKDTQKKYGFEFRAGLYANGWHDVKK
ncbi:polysaccharide lyase family 20 protein [Hypoxylon sp. FL1150]|nr:polysaccharide lyase family 20 protein [Hypoxylon sp. FL1150]